MRSKDRVRQLGEVFTPIPLVDEMLDKLDQSLFSDPSKTFCDPTCGNGNFLVRVVERKIQSGSSPLQALQTTYGCDIMADNIKEAHERLLVTASKASGQLPTLIWCEVVGTNVVRDDALKYDWEFKRNPKIEVYAAALLQHVLPRCK